MSRQLAVSIAFSVLAMAAFALFGNDTSHALSASGGKHLEMRAQGAALPALNRLLPALQ